MAITQALGTNAATAGLSASDCRRAQGRLFGFLTIADAARGPPRDWVVLERARVEIRSAPWREVMLAEFDSHWMNAWQDVVNADPGFKVVGSHFTADFLLGFGEREYVVSVREGHVERITDELTIETPWSFALRAPEESWEKFTQKLPPPMYNDIWAMAHPLHGRLRMDGDVKVLWQNIRALMWMLDRMREVPERELVEERATRV